MLGVGSVALLVKLLIATRTYGTQDIRAWTWFAEGVRDRGPVGIYGIDFAALHRGQYNHPPLVGYYLEVVNRLAQWGMPLKVTIRGVSSVADVGSALLVFEILRRRITPARALIGGLGVAASPVLLLVSGYHGNTDPLFMMLVLLGSFLIIDRGLVLPGAAALGLALGIKLVPIVVVPAVLVYVLRRQRPLLVPAVAGFVVPSALIWTPAIVSRWPPLRRNVLGYVGVDSRPWGPVHFADALGWHSAAAVLVRPGSAVVVVLCALLPAALVWRRPDRAMESVALSLVGLLVLSPAFGVQYVVWALAPAYLLDVWWATGFNVFATVVLFEVYDRWNGGLPWVGIAVAQPWTSGEEALAAVLWVVLAGVLVAGLRAAGWRGRSWPGAREPLAMSWAHRDDHDEAYHDETGT